MDEVVIRKKDLDRLARTLLKEIFEFIQDEYSLKELKKDFLNKVVLNHIICSNQKGEKYELSNSKLESLFNKDEEFEGFLKLVKDAMKDDGIDTEGIYRVISEFKLDMETHEDLYYKKEAFLDIFRVFETGYTYLED